MVRLPLPQRSLLVAATLLVAQGLPAQIPQAEYAGRRQALAQKLGDGVLLAIGARDPARDYESFFQTPSFLWLTGYSEPNASLVMMKKGSDVRWTLFVQPRDPAREVWSGSLHGTDGATRLTGIAARPVADLNKLVDSLRAQNRRLFVAGDVGGPGPLSVDAQLVRSLTQNRSDVQVSSANEAIAELRGAKSDAELELIRKAVAITLDAHREAMRAIEPGMNEFEIQSLIEYTFRRNGADRPSFASIVGSGPNSTTLHYNANDRFMNAGEVVVMDIGASYRGYAADVTRTVPINGTFSPEQRVVYQIVRDAQAAAERQARPGARASLMSDSASAGLAAGLAKLGLIESPEATYDCGTGREARECAQLRLYNMHGLGHGIGLEVHDPDQYYFTRTLAKGSAFTIEPGIYVRGNLLEILPDTPRNRAMIAKIRPAVERYRNIGVRIEDDYVIGDKGLEWISCVPREITEIEALMREPATGPAPRDASKVDWYRSGSTATARSCSATVTQ